MDRDQGSALLLKNTNSNNAEIIIKSNKIQKHETN